MDILNKMDKLYTEEGGTTINNQIVNINVLSEKSKDLTERLLAGERTSGNNNH